MSERVSVRESEWECMREERVREKERESEWVSVCERRREENEREKKKERVRKGAWKNREN